MARKIIQNITQPPNFSAFGAAIRREREKLGITLDVLAAATSISKPYLSNIETARAPGPPSQDKLRRIAAALQLDADSLLAGADWLRAPPSIRRFILAMGEQNADVTTDVGVSAEPSLKSTGDARTPPRRADGTIDLDLLMQLSPVKSRGKKSPQRSHPPDAPSATPELLPVRPVPMINRVAAGKAAEFTDLNYPAGIADAYIAAPDLPEAPLSAAFAVRVKGDSMTPDYQDGDIVVVGPGSDAPAGGSGREAREGEGAGPQDGDDCVVRLGELDEYATTFKRIFYERNTAGEAVAIRLVPLNPAHAERRVGLEQVTGIYPLMYRLVPPPRRGQKTAEARPGEPAKKPQSFTSTPLAIEND